MSWWSFAFGKPIYTVLGYDLRGRGDHVVLSITCNPAGLPEAAADDGPAKVARVDLKYLLVDFSWRPTANASDAVGDETRAFLERGLLAGGKESDRQLSLGRIAGDLQARRWPVDKAIQTLTEAARRGDVPGPIRRVLPALVQGVYAEPRRFGLCTKTGRFTIVSAQISTGGGSHKLVYNAITKAGQKMLVPPGFRWSDNLKLAMQQEIEDRRRSEFALSVMELQLRDRQRKINLLDGRMQYLRMNDEA
jgi:hypothetical protein